MPGSAFAAEVRVDGSTVLYTAGPGEAARVSVVGVRGGEFLFIDQNGAAVAAPCVREGDFPLVRCPAEGLTGARFELGPGNDEVSNEQDDSAVHLPIVVNAGEGNDSVLGTRASDVLDGGPGDDTLPGWFGDDRITGGPGDDDVRPQEGDDVADGGPGNDFVNGGEGNDLLAAGTGTDEVFGAEGDDRIDMRNGEVDTAEVACDEGDADLVLLDPTDQVLEFPQPNGAVLVQPTCERVEGQTKALKPTNVFLASTRPLKATVDVNNALPTTITVELRARGRGRTVIARGTAQRKGPRTTFRLRRTAAGRRVHGSFVPVTITATIRDSAGRTSRKSARLATRL